MAIEMTNQMELAEQLADEFASFGSDDITAFQILDVLASAGISLIENSFLNIANEELHKLLLQGTNDEII
jgi:hypothetical protein